MLLPSFDAMNELLYRAGAGLLIGLVAGTVGWVVEYLRSRKSESCRRTDPSSGGVGSQRGMLALGCVALLSGCAADGSFDAKGFQAAARALNESYVTYDRSAHPERYPGWQQPAGAPP